MKLVNLFETEDSDQMKRLTARDAADKIQDWLITHNTKLPSKLKKSNVGYKISAVELGLPYKDLTIFFSKGINSGTFGNFHGDKSKKFINLKILEYPLDVKYFMEDFMT